MIHIVFQEAGANVLRNALNRQEGNSDEIYVVKDNYAIGPIRDLSSIEGRQERREWYAQIDSLQPDESSCEEDFQQVGLIGSKLARDQEVWIWVAPNSRDVSGYLWLISQLKEFAGRVFVLNLSNLPFLNEHGGVFYPLYLFEIPASEFRKATKLSRRIPLSELESDSDEWARLQQEVGIRLLEGAKKLVTQDENYFDSELKKYVSGDWQRAKKIVSTFLQKTKIAFSEEFLLWRLQCSNSYEFNREGRPLRDFEVRRPATIPILSNDYEAGS